MLTRVHEGDDDDNDDDNNNNNNNIKDARGRYNSIRVETQE